MPSGVETALDQSQPSTQLIRSTPGDNIILLGDYTVAPLAAISARPIITLHFKFQPIRMSSKICIFWRIAQILLSLSNIKPITYGHTCGKCATIVTCELKRREYLPVRVFVCTALLHGFINKINSRDPDMFQK